MSKIKNGDSLPQFILPDQDGKLFDMSEVIGKKKCVLFFYPKDDSPGCTAEACYFRDLYEAFSEEDAVVIGISGQSSESHKEFALKHRLNYTLLSDEGNKVRKMFGVEANFFGLLPGRVTFVAGTDGVVAHTFNSQFQVEKHVDEALKILKTLK
jgi:peroxiredoxin Q/BCP